MLIKKCFLYNLAAAFKLFVEIKVLCDFLDFFNLGWVPGVGTKS